MLSVTEYLQTSTSGPKRHKKVNRVSVAPYEKSPKPSTSCENTSSSSASSGDSDHEHEQIIIVTPQDDNCRDVDMPETEDESMNVEEHITSSVIHKEKSFLPTMTSAEACVAVKRTTLAHERPVAAVKPRVKAIVAKTPSPRPAVNQRASNSSTLSIRPSPRPTTSRLQVTSRAPITNNPIIRNFLINNIQSHLSLIRSESTPNSSAVPQTPRPTSNIQPRATSTGNYDIRSFTSATVNSTIIDPSNIYSYKNSYCNYYHNFNVFKVDLYNGESLSHAELKNINIRINNFFRPDDTPKLILRRLFFKKRDNETLRIPKKHRFYKIHWVWRGIHGESKPSCVISSEHELSLSKKNYKCVRSSNSIQNLEHFFNNYENAPNEYLYNYKIQTEIDRNCTINTGRTASRTITRSMATTNQNNESFDRTLLSSVLHKTFSLQPSVFCLDSDPRFDTRTFSAVHVNVQISTSEFWAQLPFSAMQGKHASPIQFVRLMSN